MTPSELRKIVAEKLLATLRELYQAPEGEAYSYRLHVSVTLDGDVIVGIYKYGDPYVPGTLVRGLHRFTPTTWESEYERFAVDVVHDVTESVVSKAGTLRTKIDHYEEQAAECLRLSRNYQERLGEWNQVRDFWKEF